LRWVRFVVNAAIGALFCGGGGVIQQIALDLLGVSFVILEVVDQFAAIFSSATSRRCAS